MNVRVRLPETLRQDLSHVERLRLAVQRPGNGPALIPLGELVSYSIRPTPSEIDRQDLTRQVVISANLDRLPLGTALEKVGQAASQINMAPGYRVVFSGEAELMAESFGYMAEALILAILLVYLILAAQFESFIDPLSIMLSLAPFPHRDGRDAPPHRRYDQYDVTDRPDHADGAGDEECDPARRFYQGSPFTRIWTGPRRSSPQGGRDCVPS